VKDNLFCVEFKQKEGDSFEFNNLVKQLKEHLWQALISSQDAVLSQ